MKYKSDGEAKEEVKILCPFCNVPWTAEMSLELDDISNGCPTCGGGSSAAITVRITCSNCGRVVYAKETETQF